MKDKCKFWSDWSPDWSGGNHQRVDGRRGCRCLL